MNRSAILIVAAVALCTLAGCKDKLTSANYDSITMDMTLQQVEAILGKGEKQEITGVSISAGGVASSGSSNSQLTMIWKHNGKEITVTFKDGEAVNKGQYGVQ